jgi:CRISPR-associated endonuclease/helicase Cas3
MSIQEAYRCYWGKANTKDAADPTWHPFAYHSLDVAAVAAEYWERSPTIRRAFANAFAIGVEQQDQLRAWVLFFVALHDIGKLHALFLIKAPEVAALAWAEFDQRMVKCQAARDYGHGHEGFRLLKQELAVLTGADDRNVRKTWRQWRPWIAAVTGHHGEIPGENEEGRPPRGYAEPMIMEHDTNARRSWVEKAATLFLVPAGLCLSDSPPVGDIHARNLLAGFCSLCDWIGSNTDFFHYAAPDTAEGTYYEGRRRHIADLDLLKHLGLLAPILPYPGFSTLLREDEQPRGVQVMVDTLPLTAGLIIIEAPTGSGKTEAALAYAWRLLHTELAESIVFALPTQATANAMLTRAGGFGRCAFGSANLVLAHGNRSLNPEFQRLVDAGRTTTAQGREEAGVQCAAWLASSRKKVFLGQIGVCTVDQTLLSVLPVRHSFVRGFGLNRSVLIVDEVHAYDAYMNGLLGEVLRRQKAAGGSAILLSATLPAAVRAELLAAWGGEGGSEAPYPALWTIHDQAAIPLTVPDEQRPPERSVSVQLAKYPEAFPDYELIRRIAEAATAGAMVGIVMNTVDQAQRLNRLLRDSTDLPVDLFHARFRLKDRQGIEQSVIARYGREARRSGGRILVATQVIEQSLDLDFDWLLSQLCPVDLLFQRLGRLHRHDRSRPPGFESPSCTVLCPDGEDYGVHELIYGDARLLWRTERLLAERERIEFPAAYRDWIEKTYSTSAWNEEPTQVLESHYAWIQAKKNATAEASYLISSTVKDFRDDNNTATVLTRDGEMSLTVLPLLEGERTLDGTKLSALDDHERVEALLLNAVTAPCSWKESLMGYAFDDDGRIKLPMCSTSPGAWASSDGRFVYTVEFGLERVAAAGPEDPPRPHPR